MEERLTHVGRPHSLFSHLKEIPEASNWVFLCRYQPATPAPAVFDKAAAETPAMPAFDYAPSLASTDLATSTPFGRLAPATNYGERIARSSLDEPHHAVQPHSHYPPPPPITRIGPPPLSRTMSESTVSKRMTHH